MTSTVLVKEFDGKLWVLADYLQQAINDACMTAVLAEREACAAKAEQVGQHKNHIGIAAAIRARGKHD